MTDEKQHVTENQFDLAIRWAHGITTEDWCRGHYAKHEHPRDAMLAVRTLGLVTIVYLPNPMQECVEPVCEECYLVFTEREQRIHAQEQLAVESGWVEL